ncbi:hypothetical protein Ari01nite_92050 [Paractinoplanes rishiriensis]|uniref:Uncharacterized protein n=1 Tax=Paractinoplanes rishiriensis TaxID=1050105 RepID=A0A919KA87_9ACTN|nr:hypothetical protein Ari01nite_92050 [Actinoplanes rishiriensis]
MRRPGDGRQSRRSRRDRLAPWPRVRRACAVGIPLEVSWPAVGPPGTSSGFISDTVRDYLIDAVGLVATRGHRLLTDYRFDPHTGLWHHWAAATEPPLRLRDVRFDADGHLTHPQRREQAGEEALTGYLKQARAPLAGSSRPRRPGRHTT